MFLYLILTQL